MSVGRGIRDAGIAIALGMAVAGVVTAAATAWFGRKGPRGSDSGSGDEE